MIESLRDMCDMHNNEVLRGQMTECKKPCNQVEKNRQRRAKTDKRQESTARYNPNDVRTNRPLKDDGITLRDCT